LGLGWKQRQKDAGEAEKAIPLLKKYFQAVFFFWGSGGLKASRL
jgi:hypothetical protein